MKKSLIFVNNVPDKLMKDEAYVKEIITSFFDYANLDIELKVKFVDIPPRNAYEIVDCLIISRSAKDHELQIDNSVINTIYCVFLAEQVIV